MGRRFKITQTLQTKLKQKILKCILQKKKNNLKHWKILTAN